MSIISNLLVGDARVLKPVGKSSGSLRRRQEVAVDLIARHVLAVQMMTRSRDVNEALFKQRTLLVKIHSQSQLQEGLRFSSPGLSSLAPDE